MKGSSFRYLWKQVMFKKFLKFQEPSSMINKNVFRLSASTPLSPTITYAFRFLETENFLLIITKYICKQVIYSVLSFFVSSPHEH